MGRTQLKLWAAAIEGRARRQREASRLRKAGELPTPAKPPYVPQPLSAQSEAKLARAAARRARRRARDRWADIAARPMSAKRRAQVDLAFRRRARRRTRKAARRAARMLASSTPVPPLSQGGAS